MGAWHKTGCVLCAQNCGLEVFVENNRMTKVKPDKSNPRSQGYACRKGLNVMSETARLAHYVLPCRTFYEAWDAAAPVCAVPSGRG